MAGYHIPKTTQKFCYGKTSSFALSPYICETQCDDCKKVVKLRQEETQKLLNNIK